MSIPPPKPSNLSKTPPIFAPSSPNPLLASTHPPLFARARPLMLADLEKYRSKQRSLPTIPTSKTTPSIIPAPPPRGTKRYCTRRKNRFGIIRECKCGFDHDIVHPSEWRGTPAEAAWDYSVGVRNGGWGARERKVRFREPVVTYVLEGEGEGEEEESEEEKSEEEDDGEEERWVTVGRWTWNWGVVGENPDEKMEDAFEELDPSIYLGTGVLEDADGRCQQRYYGGLGNSAAERVPRQSDLAREPSVTKSSARDRLLYIVGREPSRFM